MHAPQCGRSPACTARTCCLRRARAEKPPRATRPPAPHTPAQLFEEAGTDLAQALTAKEAIAKKKAAMCPDVAKALARVSGGLYIGEPHAAAVRSAANGSPGRTGALPGIRLS